MLLLLLNIVRPLPSRNRQPAKGWHCAQASLSRHALAGVLQLGPDVRCTCIGRIGMCRLQGDASADRLTEVSIMHEGDVSSCKLVYRHADCAWQVCHCVTARASKMLPRMVRMYCEIDFPILLGCCKVRRCTLGLPAS